MFVVKFDLGDLEAAAPLGLVPQTILERTARVLLGEEELYRFLVVELGERVHTHRPGRYSAIRGGARGLDAGVSVAVAEKELEVGVGEDGNLATIGRAAAVADIKGVRLSGFPAWATWLVVHLCYLIGFQNRLLVLIRWSFSFTTHGRGARIIKDD